MWKNEEKDNIEPLILINPFRILTKNKLQSFQHYESNLAKKFHY